MGSYKQEVPTKEREFLQRIIANVKQGTISNLQALLDARDNFKKALQDEKS